MSKLTQNDKKKNSRFYESRIERCKKFKLLKVYLLIKIL